MQSICNIVKEGFSFGNGSSIDEEKNPHAIERNTHQKPSKWNAYWSIITVKLMFFIFIMHKYFPRCKGWYTNLSASVLCDMEHIVFLL